MKNIKYIFFTIMLFLLTLPNVYAECSKEEIDNFKKVEDEYTIKYKFDKESKSYILTFYYNDLNKYMYSWGEELKDAEYVEENENNFKIKIQKTGEYEIEVISTNEECHEPLKTITINLPRYNQFADDPLCEGIEEFVLCQTTYSKEIDYDTFVSRVKTYKKTKAEKNKPIEEESEENTAVEFIKENITSIIIVTVFIILLIITIFITIKSIRESRRLE